MATDGHCCHAYPDCLHIDPTFHDPPEDGYDLQDVEGDKIYDCYDCLDCGTCASCIERTIAYAEEMEKDS